jgi:N-acetylglucosaminyl-diphospho-decaprenol L-rhamnosyltransferase
VLGNSRLSHRQKLVVVIVSYGNPADVVRCLASLGRSNWGDFEVFVCENAGKNAYLDLIGAVTAGGVPLISSNDYSEELDLPGGRLVSVTKFHFSGTTRVLRIGAARENLGYAGGVNAWLERLVNDSGWDAVLVLNPDSEVDPDCLSELLARAEQGFGMVGASLVFDDAPEKIISFGLAWSRLTGRVSAVGRGALVGEMPSIRVLKEIDSISGACVLVTRAFVRDVGLMEEDYFLYMEDLDWGRRRGSHKIGYAPRAVVRHVGGTSIGSATDPRKLSSLAVYLTARNSIVYARRWAGWLWTLHLIAGFLYAAKHAASGSVSAASMYVAGLLDGCRGKTGRPELFDELIKSK